MPKKKRRFSVDKWSGLCLNVTNPHKNSDGKLVLSKIRVQRTGGWCEPEAAGSDDLVPELVR